MKVTEVLQGVGRVFLDTAPIVYFVERNAAYNDAQLKRVKELNVIILNEVEAG